VRGEIPIEEREAGNLKAETQETAILAYFEFRKGDALTPFDVQDAFPDWEIVSIRRAICNICDNNKGKIVKTKIRKMGKFGISNATWKFKEPSEEVQTVLEFQ
jgi:phage host-nuclease inhibitor protein Gam